MKHRFVIEAILMAIYGQLFGTGRQVEYIIPYSTVLELYELRDGNEPIMPDEDEDERVNEIIVALIEFFEQSFNKKKIERALLSQWGKSPPLLINETTSIIIVNADEDAQYGELFDPIETELVLTALREQALILTDQIELIDKIIDSGIEVQTCDIEDFEINIM